jgi:hypothetical protein
MKSKSTIIFFVILAAIPAYLYFQNRQLRKELSDVISSTGKLRDVYQGEIFSLQLKINRYGDTLQQARQNMLSYESALKLGVLTQEKLKAQHLKDVSNIIHLEEKISILSKQGSYIAPSDTSCGNDFTPLKISFEDPWYKIYATAHKEYPILDSLLIISYPNLTIGLQKDPGLKNIFDKPQPVIIYDNYNPYIKVTDMRSTTIYHKQKWYQTAASHAAFGFLAGLILFID